MKRAVIVLVVAVGLTIGLGAWWIRGRDVQPPAPTEHPPVAAIYKIANNLYLVPGGGGNTAVFVTATGVVLVDTKYADRYQALLDQVGTVTDKPIIYVINTHCHNDHVGGNVHVPEAAEIIVQENTARNLVEMGRSKNPDSVPSHPMRTFRDKLTLMSGEDEVDLYYFGPAHTNGDTFVVFRAAAVMHAGDVFSGKVAPIINIPWGGDGKTYGDTIGKVVSSVKGVTRVISGHGPVFSWSDFVDYGEFNRTLLEQAKTDTKYRIPSRLAAATLRLPSKFQDYQLGRLKLTIDEIYRSLRK